MVVIITRIRTFWWRTSLGILGIILATCIHHGVFFYNKTYRVTPANNVLLRLLKFYSFAYMLWLLNYCVHSCPLYLGCVTLLFFCTISFSYNNNSNIIKYEFGIMWRKTVFFSFDHQLIFSTLESHYRSRKIRELTVLTLVCILVRSFTFCCWIVFVSIEEKGVKVFEKLKNRKLLHITIIPHFKDDETENCKH